MSKSGKMYCITFKRHSTYDVNSCIVDKIIVGFNDLHMMCDHVMIHYPESVIDGNFIKIQEVVF